ncbi:hypothetical protein [Roseisolibacter sp. H3M3-2]|uniref:beta strand repeat-containing protein n=1 Tax=Roseisolibacter sp. H3M3-2 TaxID=3031323 RepID=UPI0023DCA1B4|nr:hypothetical protein [Roseisolibacter sp. H3M3-2]MDF1502598.1 hypothetical protein [Roseisolibacter sp. H3M3-2]
MALALSAAACGGGDDDGGTTGPTPTIGVTLASPTVSVQAGQNGTAAVTVTRGGGYADVVNLTVEGSIPAGTATANPASLAGGVTASTITVTTGSATPAGTYTLTVRAAGTGAVAAVTTPLTVTVTAPAPTPAFTVALAAPALTVTQGAAATNATLAITRTGGFAGAVTVTASGAPAGLTVAPAAATTGNSVDVAVSATAAVAPGTYPVTLSAAGAGIAAPQTATLTVTVQAAAPAADFSLANAAVTVQQGAAAQTATVAITRTGSFAGAVTLTTTGTIPAGLTVTPAAATTGAGVGVSVQATNAVAPGTYTIGLAATGAGVTGTKTATLTVTVTGAVQVGDFSVAVTPTTVSLQQGQTATATVNITRTGGFAAPVDVTVSGLPTGVTYQIVTTQLAARRSPAAFSADPVAGNSATIRFTAAPTAATGNFTFTVNATATGIAGTKTAQGTGSVTPASTGGGNVGLAFCAAEAPIWVGYQSEGGAWQRATLGANNQAQVNITGARGAIAYVVQSGTGASASYTTNVTYGTATELSGIGANICGAAPGTKTATATITGAAATDVVNATLGDATGTVNGSTVTFEDVQPGPRDLIATRSAAGAFPGLSGPPNRIVLRRNLNPANGASVGAIDFGGSDSFAPASARLTIAGAGASDLIIPVVGLQTANGGTGAFFNDFGAVLNPTTTPTYYGLPADRLAAGDLHYAFALSAPNGPQGPDISQARIAGAYFRTVADRTLTLGPAMNAPTVTSSNSPYPRPRVQLARQAQYGDALLAMFTQDGTTSRALSMTVLASYLQGAATWDVTFPDFSGAPGFDASWMLRSGAPTDWQVVGSGGAAAPQLGIPGTEGATFTAAIKSGTLTTAARARGVAVRARLVAGPSATAALQRQAARVMAVADAAFARRAVRR